MVESRSLFAVPPLDPSELQVIKKINEIRSRLDYATSRRRWVGLLRRNAVARAIQGSNSIEGYNVTVEDALAAVEGEEPFDTSRETWLAIAGYRNALTYVLQLADDPHFDYEEALIRSLHFMMIQHDLTKNPGRWRPGPISVRNDATGEIVYEGPDAERVPGLMEELVRSLREERPEIPVMVKAAMAHLNLVMIHPFSDGNGRMARCLQTMMLAREKIMHPQFCSIEEYLGRNTADYYSVLAQVGGGRWSPQNNARPWIRFSLTAHFRQASTLLRRQRLIGRVWDELEQEVARRGLPERMIGALVDAAVGLRIRNATYRSWAEVSENLASRDLKALVDAGFLVPKGERRGRWYEPSEGLAKLAEKFREHGPIADPFEDTGQTTLF
jgi:Fic family protein